VDGIGRRLLLSLLSLVFWTVQMVVPHWRWVSCDTGVLRAVGGAYHGTQLRGLPITYESLGLPSTRCTPHVPFGGPVMSRPPPRCSSLAIHRPVVWRWFCHLLSSLFHPHSTPRAAASGAGEGGAPFCVAAGPWRCLGVVFGLW
jgi:hypothetical protein